MSIYKVKNLNGTGDNDGKTWFKYRKENTFVDNQNICRRIDWNKPATDGAHVQIKDGQQGNEWYIIPLCHEHNMAKDIEFQVYGPLVHVDLSKYEIVK